MKMNSLKQDIEELKESTVKLGRQLSQAAQDHWDENKRLIEIPADIVTSVQSELDHLREKGGATADDAALKSKKFFATIRNNPYWALAGTLGAGMVLGRIFYAKYKRH